MFVPNKAFAFALFLSSYCPAFLILAVRFYDRSDLGFYVSSGLVAVSIFVFAAFMAAAPRGARFRGRVVEVEPHDGELAAYMATYLLPFVMVFDAEAQDVLALVLFFVIIGVLWVSTGLYYLNPLLALCGIHIYMVRVRPVSDPSAPADTMPRSFLLTRKTDLREGHVIEAQTMGRSVLTSLGNVSDSDRV